jgi:hypothetical protein
MLQHLPEDEDARLKLLFSAAAHPVADAGFSERVMARVAHAARRRRLVLGVAGAASALIAAQPVWQMARTLGTGLAERGDLWTNYAWVLSSRYVLVAGVALLFAPRIVRWLED